MRKKLLFTGMVTLISIFCVILIGRESGTTNQTLRTVASSHTINPPKQSLDFSESHVKYERLGWRSLQNEEYAAAVEYYKKAIDAVENSSGERLNSISPQEMDRINREIRIFTQTSLRYRLARAYENNGQYQEAIDQVEWLMKNQIAKGKEEMLKQKLERMKQALLQKIQQK